VGLLGDVFEALHGAPRCDQFRGVVRCSRDWDAFVEWGEQHGSLVVSAGAGAAPSVWAADVWCADGGRRVRWDSGGTINLVVDDRQTVFHPSAGATSHRVDREVVDWPTMLWQGRALLGIGDIVDVAEAELSGRSAWRVRFDRSGPSRAFNPFWIVGDRIEVTVDQVSASRWPTRRRPQRHTC
jgi:hypothetical protein